MNRLSTYCITTTVFISCFFMRGYAQEAETIQMRVHYAVKFFLYEEQEKEELDDAALDIGKTISHFYSINSVQREWIKDSILARGGKREDVFNAWQKSDYRRTKMEYQVWKNYPSPNILTYNDKHFKRFQYTEPMIRPQWNLLVNDSLIAGYKCQQAETFFLGRKWSVWFTLEIPVQEGPWMLYGLPGLILHAEDSDHLFSFSCVQVEKIDNEPFRYPDQKHVPCTKEEYKELIRLLRKDPEAFMEKMTGFRGQGYGVDGKPIVYPERTALFLDK